MQIFYLFMYLFSKENFVIKHILIVRILLEIIGHYFFHIFPLHFTLIIITNNLTNFFDFNS